MCASCTARRQTRHSIAASVLRSADIPTSIRQLEGEDSATLVRGEDRFHYFEHEPSPRIDMDPALLELHRQIAARNAKILYRGTGVTSFNDAAALRG